MAYQIDRPGHIQELAEIARNGAGDTPPQIQVHIAKDGLDLAVTWSIIGIFVLLSLAVVYIMAAVLMPITLAVVVGLILGFAADKLHKLGVSPLVSAFSLSSLFAAAVFFIVNALAEPMTRLAQDAPQMLESAIERVTPFLERFEWLHISRATFQGGSMSMEKLLENTGSVLQVVTGSLTPALVQAMIFFAALLLFLLGRLQLRKALIMTFRRREKRLATIRILNAIEDALGFYFATASVIYAALGVIVTIIAWAGGLAMPVLWGVFAFLSSFVPFLGFSLMTVALAAAGILTHDDLLTGILPAVAFLIVHLVMENIVVPAIMGKRLEINPFIIFVAIIFWTWMWGAVGAMLALPLSLIGMTILYEVLPEDRSTPNLPG
ncbi:AI-2E family transporter [Rhizobium sp. LjRoot30]|uniref:AI-2E family transporter n=1 Tax=Rhizobium sp. LjRoot30 TaxID=3342320 RepID=UPI003ECF2EFA